MCRSEWIPRIVQLHGSNAARHTGRTRSGPYTRPWQSYVEGVSESINDVIGGITLAQKLYPHNAGGLEFFRGDLSLLFEPRPWISNKIEIKSGYFWFMGGEGLYSSASAVQRRNTKCWDEQFCCRFAPQRKCSSGCRCWFYFHPIKPKLFKGSLEPRFLHHVLRIVNYQESCDLGLRRVGDLLESWSSFHTHW